MNRMIDNTEQVIESKQILKQSTSGSSGCKEKIYR